LVVIVVHLRVSSMSLSTAKPCCQSTYTDVLLEVYPIHLRGAAARSVYVKVAYNELVFFFRKSRSGVAGLLRGWGIMVGTFIIGAIVVV
jgi:hypothetical protein